MATERAHPTRAATDLDLGPRLRTLRRSKHLTLRELADRAAITESFLSQVERGVASPSIATVQRVAQALGLSIAELFAERKTSSLVRRSERDRIAYPGLRATDEFLTSAPNGRLQVILSTIEPGGGTGEEPYTHDSDEEVVIVLEGDLDVWVAGEHHVLHEGDALTLASRTPHRNTNRSERPCRVLFCITPPSY